MLLQPMEFRCPSPALETSVSLGGTCNQSLLFADLLSATICAQPPPCRNLCLTPTISADLHTWLVGKKNALYNTQHAARTASARITQNTNTKNTKNTKTMSAKTIFKLALQAWGAPGTVSMNQCQFFRDALTGENFFAKKVNLARLVERYGRGGPHYKSAKAQREGWLLQEATFCASLQPHPNVLRPLAVGADQRNNKV